jgi:hypothetical protein
MISNIILAAILVTAIAIIPVTVIAGSTVAMISTSDLAPPQR